MAKKNGGSNDMDVDLAENGEQGADEPPGFECPPCGDLDTLKGGGKGGQFQGYCAFCNTWGHKKADCRKYTAHLQALGKGGKKGEDGKGKGNSGGSGGWQTKGGAKAYGKGYGKNGKGYGKNGKSSGGVAYNIDGDDGWGQSQGSWGEGSWFFMLAEDDAESDSEPEFEVNTFEEDMFPFLGKGPSPTTSSQGSSFYEKKFQVEPNEHKGVSGHDQPWAGSLPWSSNDVEQNVWLTVDGRVIDNPTGAKSEGTEEKHSPGKSSSSTLSTQSPEAHTQDLSEGDGMEDDLDCEIPLPNFHRSEVKILQGTPQEQGNVPIAVDDNVEFLSHKLTVENDENAWYTEFFCVERMETSMSKVASAFTSAFLASNSKNEGLSWLEVCPNGLVDSSSEDELKPESKLSAKHKKFRKSRLAYARAKWGPGGKPSVDEAELESQEVGESTNPESITPVDVSMPSVTHPMSSVPMSSVAEIKVRESEKKANRKDQGKRKQNRRKLNFKTGEFERCMEKVAEKEFEQNTIQELREIVERLQKVEIPDWLDQTEEDVTMSLFDDDDRDAGEESKDVLSSLGASWRSEPQTWESKRWMKVSSVVDSGALTAVAPPSMAPNVPIVPSEGSKRGQKWTSASKHELKHLGHPSIHACTESGSMSDVLFQVAEVSKPLISVSALCERGNRVIFGRAGGVRQNTKTGRHTPF